MQQAYKRQITTYIYIYIYILFLDYIVLIATSFLLEIIYVGLSLFVCSRTKKRAGAARGGEGGALRSCKSQSLGVWKVSVQYIPCWLIKS